MLHVLLVVASSCFSPLQLSGEVQALALSSLVAGLITVLCRRASLVDRALTQPQDQLQEALARPQSSPELPLNEDMGKGRYPALEFEKQASKQGMRGRRSSSGSGNRSRSSTNSSVTITSASNADRMEGPGCSARHNAHSPSQQEDAEPQQQQQQQQQQHKECDVPSQQQGQQVEQLQSAQGQHHQHRECGVLSQKPTSFQHQHAESMHVDVRAPRPNVPSPLPAMPLLTKQTSSGRRRQGLPELELLDLRATEAKLCARGSSTQLREARMLDAGLSVFCTCCLYVLYILVVGTLCVSK
eukprot:823000-Pelagomonas_calceolata.AAC.2